MSWEHGLTHLKMDEFDQRGITNEGVVEVRAHQTANFSKHGHLGTEQCLLLYIYVYNNFCLYQRARKCGGLSYLFLYRIARKFRWGIKFGDLVVGCPTTKLRQTI